MFIILRDNNLINSTYYTSKQEALDVVRERIKIAYEYGVRNHKHLLLTICETENSVYITSQYSPLNENYDERYDTTIKTYYKYDIVELTEG